jgi:hypothetical protein
LTKQKRIFVSASEAYANIEAAVKEINASITVKIPLLTITAITGITKRFAISAITETFPK